MGEIRIGTQAEFPAVFQRGKCLRVMLQLKFAQAEHREPGTRLLLFDGHELCESITRFPEAPRIE